MNGKSLYLKIILTIIALLLALLVLEQRYIVQDEWVFNRITGEATIITKHYKPPKSKWDAWETNPGDYYGEEIDTSSP